MATNIAGYVSAGRVELAVCRQASGKISLSHQRRLSTRDWPNFEQLLQSYLKSLPSPFHSACFGVAGPVLGDTVSPTNLSWTLTGSGIRERFAFERVTLVNDLVATARGVLTLSDDRIYQVNQGESHPDGNLGLVAAGAGLGAALLVQDPDGDYVPYASEAGHGDFAPGNQREVELWEYIYGEQGRVEVEDVLSQRGLVSIYAWLTESRSLTTPDWFADGPDGAEQIMERALTGTDEVAVETVEIWLDCLSSFVSDFALNGMTVGGLFIGGVIVPGLLTALNAASFMDRFTKPGKLTHLLERMPVGIVIEERTPLLGAAILATNGEF